MPQQKALWPRSYGLVEIAVLLAFPYFLGGCANSTSTTEAYARPPLDAAAEAGNLERVKSLLAEGIPLDSRDIVILNALSFAARAGHIEIVEYLLDQGAAVNGVDTLCQAPLHDAASNNHLKTAKLLVARGANVQLADVFGETPIHKAAEKGDVSMIAYLLTRGAKPNAINNKKCTPLHLALENGNLEVARYLIENGAKPSMFCEEHGEAIHLAARSKGNLAIIQLLVRHGSKVTATDHEGYLPIHYAACHNLEMVKWLINQGSPVNVHSSVITRNEFCSTPTDYEVKYGGSTALHEGADKKEIAELLIRHGASIHAKNAWGNTPLFNCSDPQSADFLIKKGANPKVTNKFGCNLLHWECDMNSKDQNHFKYLLDLGIDPNAVTKDGDQALHYACKNRNWGFTKLLIDHGANIHTRDSYGNTPLAIAVIKNSPYQDRDNSEIVDYLIKYGADINSVNNYGKSIIALCDEEDDAKKISRLGAKP